MHDKAQMMKNIREKSESVGKIEWVSAKNAAKYGERSGQKNLANRAVECAEPTESKKRLIKQLTKAGFIHNTIHAPLLLKQNARAGQVGK